MAPFYGPSLVGIVELARRGQKRVPFGRGVPSAELIRDGAELVVFELEGGAGFGVQADLVEPIVRGKERVRAAGVGELILGLVRMWQPSRHGPLFEESEALELRFEFKEGSKRALQLSLQRHLEVGLLEAGELARRGSYRVADPKALERALKAFDVEGVRLQSSVLGLDVAQDEIHAVMTRRMVGW